MASNSDKLLLKQITDLTRQIEKQRNGFSRHPSQSKKFVKPWTKKSSATFFNAYASGTQHWHKPSLISASSAQPRTSANSKSSLKPSESGQSGQQHNSKKHPSQLQIKNPAQGTATNSSQVFVNPNFVSKKVGISVHVNPNFRSQSPILPTTKTQTSGSVEGTSSGAPVPPTTHVAPSAPSRGLTASSSGNPSSSAPADPSGYSHSPSNSSGHSSTGSLPAGRRVPVPVPTVPSPTISPAPAIPARTRRRSLSRSLSSRYRLLTARKLVRRRSKETRTPPARAPGTPAARRPALITRHKLVRAGGTPRAPPQVRQPANTRHRLVRATNAPRTQQLHGRQATSRAGSSHWSSARTPASPARPASSSRYKLVRTAAGAGKAAVRPVPSQHRSKPALSQHRTWRRRSSGGTPGSRLTSAGSLRLGSTRFVNIGGLLYKSTARKLQRAVTKQTTPKNKVTKTVSSPPSASRRPSTSPSWISVRGARFRVEAGGRSLRRLDRGPGPAPPRLDIGGLTFRPAADGTLTADGRQLASRSLISRAKSRSLAVLRSSLSRQPCRWFCRWGRCRRHEQHRCPHVHDPALRPVCTRHLREGGCRRAGCPYNHDPRPEKVPHCLHFLTAECRREGCPYQHVNVDADAPLCKMFLAGFCAKGQQCPDKHLYICPEFSESGKCPRGASCTLAHRAKRRRRRSSALGSGQPTPAPPRGTGRYYAGGEAATGEREERDSEGEGEDGKSEGEEGQSEEEEEGEGQRRERPAMLEMPSFIAIADSSDED